MGDPKLHLVTLDEQHFNRNEIFRCLIFDCRHLFLRCGGKLTIPFKFHRNVFQIKLFNFWNYKICADWFGLIQQEAQMTTRKPCGCTCTAGSNPPPTTPISGTTPPPVAGTDYCKISTCSVMTENTLCKYTVWAQMGNRFQCVMCKDSFHMSRIPHGERLACRLIQLHRLSALLISRPFWKPITITAEKLPRDSKPKEVRQALNLLRPTWENWYVNLLIITTN